MSLNQQVKKIVNKLGGDARASVALEISVDAIRSWKYRTSGIPKKYWRLIQKLDASITLEELAACDGSFPKI